MTCENSGSGLVGRGGVWESSFLRSSSRDEVAFQKQYLAWQDCKRCRREMSSPKMAERHCWKPSREVPSLYLAQRSLLRFVLRGDEKEAVLLFLLITFSAKQTFPQRNVLFEYCYNILLKLWRSITDLQYRIISCCTVSESVIHKHISTLLDSSPHRSLRV